MRRVGSTSVTASMEVAWSGWNMASDSFPRALAGCRCLKDVESTTARGHGRAP